MSTNEPLYVLNYQIAEALALAEQQAEESPTGEMSVDLAARLDALSLALEVKVQGLCQVLRHSEVRAEGIQMEIDRLTVARDAEARRVEWIKGYIKTGLEAIGVKKLETPLFKVRVQKNSQPSVKVEAGALGVIPEGFGRVVPEKVELDRGKVVEAWKRGEELPEGVKVEVGSHLRIS